MNAPISPVKQWLTASELAEAQLPSLPETERGVRKMAAREGWPSRDRIGRGGGREYPLEALPAEARAAYLGRHLQAVEVPVVLQASQSPAEPETSDLCGRAAEARDARLALLQILDRYIAESGVTKRLADQHFCDLYNSERIEVADWIRRHVRSITPSTLFRWRAARRDGRTKRLGVDKAAARKGCGVLDQANGGEVKTFLLALLVKQPHLTAKHLRRALEAQFEGGLDLVSRYGEIRRVPVPPLRTIQWAIGRWKEELKVELTALTNPDAFKSKYRASGRNSYRHVTRLNQLWMIDASPADVLCSDGRHSIYAAIDVYSRRLLISVSRTPRAAAVCALMRRTILAWGAPDRVKTDNGSDFTARQTTMLMANLGIDVSYSQPFTPEEKAFVERAIGTLQRGLMPLLEGFIGHDVADRKQIEQRKAFAARLGEDPAETFCVALTGADLQRECDRWVEAMYMHEPHAGLGKRTPFELVSASREAIRTVDERALDILLMPIAGRDGIRTVSKSGIRIDHHWYLVPHLMPETRVLVRMDPADLGRAYLFTPEGDEFLGEATCPVLAGIDPAAAVRAVKAEQKRIIDERMAPVKAEVKKLAKGPRLADLVMRQAARDAGKLVELPKPRVEHTTPQIEAAIEAMTPRHARPVELRPDDAAIHAELVAAAEADAPVPAPESTVKAFPEQPKHRFRRAVELERRIAAGQGVSTDEALWLGRYQTSAEYLAHQDLHRDFGDEWLFA
ncbi:transposase InsO family protein [Chelatococcus caeni]|uniref:Transposase InsO family protein n=1 Tax=Chelatococcus caeni TaxID=1348468 RepID=A0A840BVV3_9HYPH|nr:transposase InsO family protein [Chelatococcus caeni]